MGNGNAREAWDRIGAPRELLRDLRFDVDQGMELRIQVCAVRDARFWRMYGDLLQPEFFGQEPASTFMTVVQEYAAATGAVPDHTIARDLIARIPGIDARALSELLSHADAVYSSTPVGVDYVGQRVEELGRKRAIRAAVIRIADINEKAAKPDDEPTTDAIADVMAAALALGSKDPNPVYSFRRDYHLLPQWQAQFTSGSVRTMLTPLDDALQGGLMLGELGVVLAPPHRGKTLTLVNFAAGAMVAGADTLYVTTEDGVRGIGPRIAANLSGVPREEFHHDWGGLVSDLGRMMALFGADIRIVYRPPRKTGVPEIRALLDRLAAEDGFRPRLLILDYADRLKAPRKRKDRWDELVDLYMDLRALADEKGVAIWTASQTGKGGFGKEVVDMDDFAGAFQKAGEADVVLAFSQTSDEKAAGEARLHLTKARNRGSGKIIHVYADVPRSLLREVPVSAIPQLVGVQKKPTPNAPRRAPAPAQQPVPTSGLTP